MACWHIAVALFLAWSAPSDDLQSAGAAALRNLRCEYLVNPRGIDRTAPRLSWELTDSRRGVEQIAYQILAASDPERLARDQGDLWDSGRVESRETTHIVYAGRALVSRARVHWKVRAWCAALDTQGDRAADPQSTPWSQPAFFSLGLLQPSDWHARWIGDVAPEEKRIAAHNGYHSEMSPTAETVKWVQIDLGEPKTIHTIRLWPARPFDWSADVPGFLFPLRYRIEVSDDANFESPRIVVDRSAEDSVAADVRTAHDFAPTVTRYVRLTATRLRERNAGHYGMALAEMEVMAAGENFAHGRPVTALDSIEHHHWSTRNLVDDDIRSHAATPLEPLPPLGLQRRFSVPSAIQRATAYVTALGCYDLQLNGRRVGNHVLAPEWTNYHKAVQYQTYDVTELVSTGENTLEALVGDGWYAGKLGLAGLVPDGPNRGIYGRRPRFLMQLEFEDAAGRTETIVTDGEWKGREACPLRASDLLDGESVGLGSESRGKPVTLFGRVGQEGPMLRAQPNEPIRITREIKPVGVSEPKPGVFVFDMGQNMVGWCRVALPAVKLKSARSLPGISLRFAEVLNPDGTIYTANLRGAAQTDAANFDMLELPQTWEPHFTYHGFRYAQITGLDKKPPLDALTGCVINSDCREVGRFECSDPRINKLMSNILWTQRGNLMSTPTDCPQRDERLGWMGDILAFAQTACFNMDMAAFFTKWIPDVREAQADDGRYPDFAPHPYDPNVRCSGVPAWGDAGVFVPWVAWVNYGDRRLLEEHYDSMKRWVDWIHRENPDLLWKNKRHNDYGDWLNADTLKLDRHGWPKTGAEMPKDAFATAFFARSTELLARMAAIIGKTDDAKRYADLHTRIKAAFNSAFVSADGRILGDTQAGYAIALAFDLLPESTDASGATLRNHAADHMVAAFAKYKGCISTGFHSTTCLMNELTRAGRTDEAYKLLLNPEMPGWLYPIEHGATTIWERWDGYVEGRGFQDPGMNSFAHYALGSVGEWIWRTVAGINPNESAPGYSHIVIQPRPGGGLTWARGEYDSIRGTIAVNWRIEEGELRLDVTIPPNARATIHVPARSIEDVSEGGVPAKQAPGVTAIGARSTREGTIAQFEVGSGTYQFRSQGSSK